MWKSWLNGHPLTNRNIFVLSVSTAALVAALFSWYRILALIFRELGASDLETSFAFALLAGAMALGQYPGGILAEKYGRKPLIVIPTYIAAVLYVVAAMAPTWQILLLALIGVNLASALQSASFVMLLAESASPQKRGSAFGTFQFFIGFALIVGPLMGAYFQPLENYRFLIGFTAITALVVGAFRQKHLYETLEACEDNPVDTMASAKKSFTFTDILKGKLGWLLIIAIVVASIPALTIYGPFIALYAEDVQGFTPGEINLFFAYGAILATIVSLLAGPMTERWGNERILVIGAIGHVLLLYVWLSGTTFWFAALMIALGYGFLQMLFVAFDTMRATIASEYQAGPVLGAIGMMATLASALIVPIAGYGKEIKGPMVPFIIAFILGLSVVFLVIKIKQYEIVLEEELDAQA